MAGFLLRRLVSYVVLALVATFLAFTLASAAFDPIGVLQERNPPPPAATIEAKKKDLHPIPDPARERRRERIILTGDLPSPANPPSGCRFRTRCFLHASLPPREQRTCVELEPPREVRADDHEAACHFAQIRQVL